jgi:hypothetical protein
MTHINGAAHSIKTYRLKHMVAARLCVEAAVFIILLALPLVLLVLGKLAALGFTYKTIVAILGLAGLVMLPVYGFITFKVTITEDKLTTHSVFQRHSCLLSEIKGLTRRSNWNWIRYVLEFAGGELTFPIWLKNCDELVTFVREQIPAEAGGGKRSAVGRRFTQDPVSLTFQIGQAVVGLVFIGVVWVFAKSLYHSGTAGISPTDEALVIVFAVIISAILLWRTVVVALMPTSITVGRNELALQTFFFELKLPWDKVKAIKEPFPLLPEGFMLHTKKGNYLIGNGMDSADELSDAIKEKLPKVPDKQ